MGLTYGGSSISAMLDDVWSDVGNVRFKPLSTSGYDALIVSTWEIERKLKVSSELRIRLIRVLRSES